MVPTTGGFALPGQVFVGQGAPPIPEPSVVATACAVGDGVVIAQSAGAGGNPAARHANAADGFNDAARVGLFAERAFVAAGVAAPVTALGHELRRRGRVWRRGKHVPHATTQPLTRSPRRWWRWVYF